MFEFYRARCGQRRSRRVVGRGRRADEGERERERGQILCAEKRDADTVDVDAGPLDSRVVGG